MINLVFFSNVSNNTARFVDKLDLESLRIPILSGEQPLYVTDPYVLVSPTYGGGSDRGAVPAQVKKFLNNEKNRSLARGIIAAGNTNFGEHFCLAGDIISKKLNIAYLYRFEIMGTPEDVETVRIGLNQFWKTQGAEI